jgi:fructose-1,6-bisphosphatase I
MSSYDYGITAQQHILLQQKERFPDASGEFSWLLSGITLAAKMIESQVRRAGLVDVLGTTGETNVQGESVQKLDHYANAALMHCLGKRGNVGIIASEENEHPEIVLRDPAHGKYIVVFDPLDGSSNIDVNISTGTIFSILRRDPGSKNPEQDVLQAGYKQIAAGYVLYSTSTILVYTTGNGVNGFTLDPAIGAFLLSHANIRIPERGNQYSTNEANFESFPLYCRRFLHWFKSGADGRTYTSRYVGSLVADFHRTLLKGGIFFYPPTASSPSGKLRLMYEANPIAFVCEQAGGTASDGSRRIMEIQPDSVHQRTPLAVGSPYEMGMYLDYAKKDMGR